MTEKEKLIELINRIDCETFFAYINVKFEYYAKKWGLI